MDHGSTSVHYTTSDQLYKRHPKGRAIFKRYNKRHLSGNIIHRNLGIPQVRWRVQRPDWNAHSKSCAWTNFSETLARKGHLVPKSIPPTTTKLKQERHPGWKLLLLTLRNLFWARTPCKAPRPCHLYLWPHSVCLYPKACDNNWGFGRHVDS